MADGDRSDERAVRKRDVLIHSHPLGRLDCCRDPASVRLVAAVGDRTGGVAARPLGVRLRELGCGSSRTAARKARGTEGLVPGSRETSDRGGLPSARPDLFRGSYEEAAAKFDSRENPSATKEVAVSPVRQMQPCSVKGGPSSGPAVRSVSGQCSWRRCFRCCACLRGFDRTASPAGALLGCGPLRSFGGQDAAAAAWVGPALGDLFTQWPAGVRPTSRGGRLVVGVPKQSA